MGKGKRKPHPSQKPKPQNGTPRVSDSDLEAFAEQLADNGKGRPQAHQLQGVESLAFDLAIDGEPIESLRARQRLAACLGETATQLAEALRAKVQVAEAERNDKANAVVGQVAKDRGIERYQWDPHSRSIVEARK